MENPYNSRKKIVRKSVVLAGVGALFLLWIASTLLALSSSSSSSSSTTPQEKQKQNDISFSSKIENPGTNQDGNNVGGENTIRGKIEDQHPQQEQKQKPPDDKKEKQKTKQLTEEEKRLRRRRYRETHDFRTIKIDTPPPRANKDHHNDPAIRLQVKELVEKYPDIYKGREKLVGMLLEMYVNVTAIDPAVWKQVPTWKQITRIHGSKPVIHGLDSCEAFRERVPAIDRHVGVAGIFNTGTNLLAILLQHNCAIPEGIAKRGRKKGHGMEWQVPWGKHSPAWYRGQGHVKNFIGRIPVENIMVAVMVRHAHDWMKSMCRHGYTAKWKRNARNCPNLYPHNTVKAKFGPGPSEHDNLAAMWNDWNGAYFYANETSGLSRVMVRFEDTIFFPKETSRIVCSCVGGRLVTPKERDSMFHYVIDSAKTGPGHGPGKRRNGLLDAWIKYGVPRDFSKYSKSDLEFANATINRDIMNAMDWKFPEMPGEKGKK